MPSISHSKLTEAVEEAIASSGYIGVIVSQQNDVPTRFLVSAPSQASVPIWVYIKNLTPADRADPDEYRIQLSSKILPLAMNPDGPTLLLGYHAALKLFVGFDPHAISTGAKTQLSGGYRAYAAKWMEC